MVKRLGKARIVLIWILLFAVIAVIVSEIPGSSEIDPDTGTSAMTWPALLVCIGAPSILTYLMVRRNRHGKSFLSFLKKEPIPSSDDDIEIHTDKVNESSPFVVEKSFKIPFFKRNREKLAMDIFLDAKTYVRAANKARNISDFIKNYDLLLEAFEKLSSMNGKVSNLKGNLTEEYWKFESEFQNHLHDAVGRSAEEIISENKGLYKYDSPHIKSKIIQFKSDIVTYENRFNPENKEFAWAQFRFLCHDCKHVELLSQYQKENKSSQLHSLGLDKYQIEKAIEIIFRYRQASASLLERHLKISFPNANTIIERLECYGIVSRFDGKNPREVLAVNIEDARLKICNFEKASLGSDVFRSNIDNMNGHEFEHWCAELLERNGFENVEVTPGSGDQGVDVLAEKGGVKYAIQCKCYSHDLGNSPIQEVESGRIYYGCHVGVVMTNRYFTQGAKKLAQKTGTLLWDRDCIEKMVKK